MATPPRTNDKRSSKSPRQASAKPVAKKSAASANLKPPALRVPSEGPLTLKQAQALVLARPEPLQAAAAAGAVRRRAPGALAKAAVAPAAGPATPQTVETARRLLAVQQHEELKQRLRDYKATLALLQRRGVKGLPEKAPAAKADTAGAPKRRRAGGASTALAAASGPLRVFAEGDSWFDYPAPNPFFGGGVIPRLEDRLGVPILNLAKAGDETRFMLGVTQRQQIARYLTDGCPDGQPWDLMLFSGGGNDIVDEPLALWLNPFEAKKSPKKLLNQSRFSIVLAMVQAAYEDLIGLRNHLSPTTHLAFHGYDFAIPDGRGICHLGPWLKPAFDLHGYPADLVASTAVVKEMLTQFGAMLAGLAKKPGVTFINAQGGLPPVKSSWHNELHPSKAGFKQVADRFKAEIAAVFPGRVVA